MKRCAIKISQPRFRNGLTKSSHLSITAFSCIFEFLKQSIHTASSEAAAAAPQFLGIIAPQNFTLIKK